MSSLRLTWALAWLAFPATVLAVDPGRFDRIITREPAYRSKPRYCLLVVGSEARTRVWLVLDGDVLYVDRNGNGDLTEGQERFPALRQGGPEVVNWFEGAVRDDSGKAPLALKVWSHSGYFVVEVKTASGRSWLAGLSLSRGLADRREQAPVLHVDGPLTVRLHRQPVLVPGQECRIAAEVGTWGVGPQSFSCLRITGESRPVAEIEFPSSEPGAKPASRKVALTETCCGSDFAASVGVPEKAGPGKARITISFPDSRDGKVTPATFEVPVVRREF